MVLHNLQCSFLIYGGEQSSVSNSEASVWWPAKATWKHFSSKAKGNTRMRIWKITLLKRKFGSCARIGVHCVEKEPRTPMALCPTGPYIEKILALILFWSHWENANGGMAEWLERRTRNDCFVTIGGSNLGSYSRVVVDFADNVSSCDLSVDDRQL